MEEEIIELAGEEQTTPCGNEELFFGNDENHDGSSVSVPELEKVAPLPLGEIKCPGASPTEYPDEELYNPKEKEKEEELLGTLDCRSECKYITGDASKRMNYGYSD